MFPPFTNASEFFPGLIIWCLDPYETINGPTFPVDVTKRDQRPCLVLAVDVQAESLQIARLCETTPTNTREWVRINTAPIITWKNADAWIWVGAPATIRMTFYRTKIMHAHRDRTYITHPVSSQNIAAYWVHRRRFLSEHPRPSAPINTTPSTRNAIGRVGTDREYPQPPASPAWSTTTQLSSSSSSSSRATSPNPPQSWLDRRQSSFQLPYLTPDAHLNGYSGSSSQAMLNPSSAASVPRGFTETHPARPGWFRNPENGWFWHAAMGMMEPDSPFLERD
ncbi:hypothetical protein MIND_01168100 [Mycena indigotica]|uniref:Uncharacterized protein n=1 Tax=Mycena indigotica TaxID=2126181 RepID=A0A8H6S4E4_9AGAR|nr:uncharacterized protein MIND_01168100 [Mycena indigotica]KAF7292699.1 hypothetical protein MIND_01168100 [Mycena indigotica]